MNASIVLGCLAYLGYLSWQILLFALVTSDSKMQIFSALKGRYLGTINEVSQHPYTLFGM